MLRSENFMILSFADLKLANGLCSAWKNRHFMLVLGASGDGERENMGELREWLIN